MTAEIEVLHPGLYSCIQDLGRYGFLKYGVPISGAMDKYAARIGNLILQNPENSAVLEMTIMGPRLKFSYPATIVITGADLSADVNGEKISNNKVYSLKGGDILSFGKRINGCRSYLAIGGGFLTENILNSRSWYEGITSHFKLKKGLVLEYQKFEVEIFNRTSSLKKDLEFMDKKEVEVYAGPEYHYLSGKIQQDLMSLQFTIDKNNNRMAIQLTEVVQNNLNSIITGPVVPGTVQLTPSGKLIILMRDCQTTGGYPRVLQLSEKAINLLSQKVQGDPILFRKK